MNAHELDEWIDNSPYTEREAVIQLLRQQAARIAELEQRLDHQAGEIMSLENQIGGLTGYGHN